MEKKEKNPQQRIACAKVFLGAGKEARTIKGTGRLTRNDLERWMLDQSLLGMGTFIVREAGNQLWIRVPA